jgi:hypothetical protein
MQRQDPVSELNCEPFGTRVSLSIMSCEMKLVTYDRVAQRSHTFNGNFHDVSWH